MTSSNPLNQDYTPGPVVTQIGHYLLDHLVEEPVRHILDPSAGSGVYGQRLAPIFPKAKTCAIEPRESEAKYLKKNYDRYVIGEVKKDKAPVLGRFDLIITNPPFALWDTFADTLLDLLSDRGLLVLLGLTSWGQRSKAGYELFQRRPPLMQLRIPGTLKFRNGLNPATGKAWGSDTRDYCHWIWDACRDPGVAGWHVENLRRLDAPDRRYGDVKPGRGEYTYEPRKPIQRRHKRRLTGRLIKGTRARA